MVGGCYWEGTINGVCVLLGGNDQWCVCVTGRE